VADQVGVVEAATVLTVYVVIVVMVGEFKCVGVVPLPNCTQIGLLA
jgi:hypothetical protein